MSEESPAASSADESTAAETDEESAGAGSKESTKAATSASKSAGAGAAASGANIKAGALAKLPAAVGDWKKQAGSAGDPGTIYLNGDKSVVVGNDVMSAPYESLVEFIVTKKTKAGTGLCGATEGGNSLTCYLKAADGTINVSASPDDTPLPDLVSFVTDFTKAVGTS